MKKNMVFHGGLLWLKIKNHLKHKSKLTGSRRTYFDRSSSVYLIFYFLLGLPENMGLQSVKQIPIPYGDV